MTHPTGTVRALLPAADGGRVLVDVDAATACARCAAGKGCGAGLLAGPGGRPCVEARVSPGLQLQEGDAVELELGPGDLLRAAAAAYGLPLCGALLFAAAAHGAGLGDAAAAVSALAGLGTGLVAGRRYLARPGCLHRFLPTVTGRVGYRAGPV